MSSSRAKLIGPETCSLRSSDENWSHKPASRGAQQGTCIMHQRVAWTLNKRKDPFSIPLFPSAHKSGVADGVRADVTPSPLRCMAPAGLCTEDETKTGSGLKILITRQLSKTSFQLQLVNSSTNKDGGESFCLEVVRRRQPTSGPHDLIVPSFVPRPTLCRTTNNG